MSKILVIEDDFYVRVGIVDLLTVEGYEVFDAENGRKGIEYAKKYLPDLIISDILMPEVDGYSVFLEMQKEIATSSIPFIFLTAKAKNSDIRFGMDLGADDYLTKPYKVRDLISAVESKLIRKRYIDKKLDKLNEGIVKNLPHKLRTPLVAVINFSQLIMDNYSDINRNEILEMINDINKAGYSLHKILEKFLLFSEIEIINSDKSQLKALNNLKPIYIKDLISTAAGKVINEYGRGKDLKMNLEDAELFIYKEHLIFVVEELIENACKFSSKGFEIFVNSHIEDDKFILEITDHGIGIGSENIKEIGILKQFNRDNLFQPGLGLGLIVVQKIVGLYKGEFNITSEENNFTTVGISFKLK